MISRSSDSVGSGPVEPLHERLRHRRLASGLDLEALARETKIQLRYLEAIEQGQVHLLPQGVYMRNFIRIYLRAIGVENSVELQNTIDSLTAGVLRLPTAAALGGAAPSGGLLAGFPPVLLAVLTVLLLALGAALWLLFGRGGADDATDALPTPVAAAQPTAPPTPVPSPTPRPGANLKLRAKRQVALTVTGEASGAKPMTLKKDETVQLFVDEPVTIELGSAGAIELSVDGQPLPADELKGKTIRIDPADFVEDDGETAEPTPAHSP